MKTINTIHTSILPCVDSAEIEATAATSEHDSYAELPGPRRNSHVSSERPGRFRLSATNVFEPQNTVGTEDSHQERRAKNWERTRQGKIPILREQSRRVRSAPNGLEKTAILGVLRNDRKEFLATLGMLCAGSPRCVRQPPGQRANRKLSVRRAD